MSSSLEFLAWSFLPRPESKNTEDEKSASVTEPASTPSKSRAESLALGWIAPDCELIRYSFSLDDKNWYEISKVYTEDVDIYYPEPVGPIAGLANVMVVMETMLESMLTMYSLTTQNINITNYGMAMVKTYGRPVHFDTGKLVNQSVSYGSNTRIALSRSTIMGWQIAESLLALLIPLSQSRWLAPFSKNSPLDYDSTVSNSNISSNCLTLIVIIYNFGPLIDVRQSQHIREFDREYILDYII
ncbi:hypothetical protein AUP68_02209 [Ilyonectria robusta]